jgi:RND family efflux transporter MFP subunit
MKMSGYQIIILLPVCMAIVISSCNSTAATPEAEPEQNIVLPVATATQVSTEIALSKNFQYFIQTNGKIRSLNQQLITVENGGRLVAYHAQVGKVFTAGTVIAKMETTPVQHRLERAQLTLFNSQKEYESQLLGYENLMKDKTTIESDAIKQKLRISTGLAGAEQEIKEAKYELTKSLITAPFTGVLAGIKGQAGQLLAPGYELFTIYDPDNLLLEVKILEADITLLKKKMGASVAPVSSPDLRYAAEVYEIDPYVDENGMVLARLRIKTAASSTLFPGMNCTATIEVPVSKAVVVPKEAVVMRSGQSVVFTLNDGKAKWNYVKTGRDNGQEIEIRDGISAGMKVIISNNLQLSHDAPVQEAAPAFTKTPGSQ